MKTNFYGWVVYVLIGVAIDTLVYLGYMKFINNNPSAFTGGVILLISSALLGIVFLKFFNSKEDEK